MTIGILSGDAAEADLLRRAVCLRPEHRVLWVAPTIVNAIGLCATEPPALVLIDVVRGGIDPATATRQIRAAASCAIVIVTSSVRACAALVYEAMGQGALDAVDAPLAEGRLEERAAPLLAKLATVASLIGHVGAYSLDQPASDRSRATPLVAMGASAGGPGALAAILCRLPSEFPAAIVVVQHVEPRFADGMAQWLGNQSALPVRIAVEGERPAEGTVLLAGRNQHLVFKHADRLGYTPEPLDHAHCPSIDVFFESLDTGRPGGVIGVLLTGMGRDGAAGLKRLRDRGCHTIAQDESSSVVYGMPRAAARLNAAIDILPMERIASRLIELVGEAHPAARASWPPDRITAR